MFFSLRLRIHSIIMDGAATEQTPSFGLDPLPPHIPPDLLVSVLLHTASMEGAGVGAVERNYRAGRATPEETHTDAATLAAAKETIAEWDEPTTAHMVGVAHAQLQMLMVDAQMEVRVTRDAVLAAATGADFSASFLGTPGIPRRDHAAYRAAVDAYVRATTRASALTSTLADAGVLVAVYNSMSPAVATAATPPPTLSMSRTVRQPVKGNFFLFMPPVDALQPPPLAPPPPLASSFPQRTPTQHALLLRALGSIATASDSATLNRALLAAAAVVTGSASFLNLGVDFMHAAVDATSPEARRTQVGPADVIAISLNPRPRYGSLTCSSSPPWKGRHCFRRPPGSAGRPCRRPRRPRLPRRPRTWRPGPTPPGRTRPARATPGPWRPAR